MCIVSAPFLAIALWHTDAIAHTHPLGLHFHDAFDELFSPLVIIYFRVQPGGVGTPAVLLLFAPSLILHLGVFL